VAGLVDHIEFVEPLRQIGGLAHIVDCLADIPLRRHSDEVGLHSPAGGAFRVVEAAGKRDALGRRQLFEDLGAVFGREILQQRDGVVGLQFAHALGDRTRRQFLEDFLAHRVVDFGERGEVEIDAEQFDQARPLLRRERLDQRPKIGLVQVADQLAQIRHIGRLDRRCNRRDEVGADGAIVVAQGGALVF
jgi:hypothetical protein